MPTVQPTHNSIKLDDALFLEAVEDGVPVRWQDWGMQDCRILFESEIQTSRISAGGAARWDKKTGYDTRELYLAARLALIIDDPNFAGLIMIDWEGDWKTQILLQSEPVFSLLLADSIALVIFNTSLSEIPCWVFDIQFLAEYEYYKSCVASIGRSNTAADRSHFTKRNFGLEWIRLWTNPY